MHTGDAILSRVAELEVVEARAAIAVYRLADSYVLAVQEYVKEAPDQASRKRYPR